MTLTYRERWQINRDRRKAGLREIDKDGNEIVPLEPKPRTAQQMQDLIDQTVASYDPKSPHYRAYQGD
jgi:hypothetical protein